MEKKKSDLEEVEDQTGQPIEPNKEVTLPQDLKNILATLEPDVQEKILQSFSLNVTRSTSFRGPLPPPEHLEGYNRVVEGGAERIFRMAERQSEHRVGLEDHSVKEGLKQSGRGQWFGFVLALVLIASAVFLAVNGHDVVAGILGGTTIVGLVTVFVIGKQRQQDPSEENQ